MIKIVLDTNSFVSSISKKSDSYIVWKKLQQGEYTLYVTNEILNEYQEIIERYTTPLIANNIIFALLSMENVVFVQPQFRFNLIQQDNDDNKFVDCAIVSNAMVIVTDDAHFNVLDTIPFPKVNHIKLAQFVKHLKSINKKK